MDSPDTNATPLTIFLVENHPDTLRFLTFYLEQSGHTVHTATSIADARKSIPFTDFDVLLSDIALTDGEGWDLMREVRAKKNAVYGIALSGFGMQRERQKSLDAGFRHHLVKPFLPEELDAILANAAVERGQLAASR